MINKESINFYAESTKLLAFPTSTVRNSPSGSGENYPDGRRFSEYNLTQLNKSLVNYSDLDSDGYVLDYELNGDNTAISKLILVIQGYVFCSYDELELENNGTPRNWYASIILQTTSTDTLSGETESMLRLVDSSNGQELSDYYCEALIFTEQEPVINTDGITTTLENMIDPSGEFHVVTGGQSRLFTVPVVVDGKVCSHRFASNSIKNINGGTC